MTYLVERLGELRRHLDHLKKLRPRVTAPALAADLSLHNDVLFSLLTVCQRVIDLAGKLSARRGLPFEDYPQAVRNLGAISLVEAPTLAALERLPRPAPRGQALTSEHFEGAEGAIGRLA